MRQCTEWTKGLSHNGYALTTRKNKTYRAHRLAYCDSKGITHDSIKGQVVRHTCDNRRCVNPQHLELGSHKDNMADMVSRGRSAKGLVNGAGKLTPKQVRHIRATYVKYSKTHGTVALAKLYGVANSTIGRALRGATHTAEQGASMAIKNHIH